MNNGFQSSRRRFLQTSVGVLAGLGLSFQSISVLANEARSERSIRLYNPHTEESLVATYWADGEYIDESLLEINSLLRDRRSGEQCEIDVGLIERLYVINSTVGFKHWIDVLCGYRSPETNKALRRVNHGVSRNSLHMEGRAADIRIEGVSTEKVRDVSLDLRLGGVGYYSRRHFVHIDSGNVRFWRG